MKKHLLLILSAVLVVTGCKKEKGGDGGNAFVPPAQEQLLQTAYADHEDTGGGFTFTTDAAWTATVDEGQAQVPGQSAVRTKSDARVAETGNNVVWLKLYNGDTETYEGGSGTVTIRIEMDQNYTGEKRTATITVRSGNHVFTVTVVQEGTKQDGSGNPAPVPVEGIELSETELRLDAGETATLAATVMPENATIKSVTWASSDPQIATVHPVSGLITAVADGTAVVTATSSSNKQVSAGCTVTIGAGEEEPADDPEPEPTENIVVALEHGAGFHDLLTAEQVSYLNRTDISEPGHTYDENSPYNRLSPKFAVATHNFILEEHSDGNYYWTDAREICKNYNQAGTGAAGTWRLPTIPELQLISKLYTAGTGELYNSLSGDIVVGEPHCSGVSKAGDPDKAWFVRPLGDVDENNVELDDKTGRFPAFVRCVRDLDYVVEPEPAPTENIIVASDNGIAASDQLTAEEVDYLNRTDISAPGHTYDENSPYNKVSPKFALATCHTTLKDHADRNCYWTDAYEICKSYNQAGTGASGTWRLPTLAELQLIRTLYTIDEGEYWENLKGELLVNERHCSGVSKAGDPDKAWFMDPKGFEDENYQKVGFVMPLEKVGGGSAFVRCVRDL